MTKKRIALTCLALTTAACVSNPAKHPVTNGQEITFNREEHRFLRGSEELDEQDYYMLLGDNKAEEEVASHRASGVRRQGIGAVLMLVGVAAVAATLYAFSKNDELPQAVTYAGTAGGAILFLGGQQLRSRGKARVQDRPILHSDRAEAALNIKRYGAATVGPGIVKEIDWDIGTTYCGSSGAKLRRAVAKDQSHREIDLNGREDWLAYSSVPADQLASGDLTVRSPLLGSLDKLGMPITVKVSVKGGTVAKTVELAQSLTCSESLRFAGAPGDGGTKGSKGSKGNVGADGGAGGNGSAGGSGGDGGDVDVEAAYVTYKGRRYLAVAASQGSTTQFAIVDATKGSISVTSAGGNGGRGGSGGDGGDLMTRASDGKCNRITSGAGGVGGPGGTGGRGGTVRAHGPREAIDALKISIDGGLPGDGGSPGDHGGTGISCIGNAGERGKGGTEGQKGTKGKIEKQVTSMSNQSALARWLATNPAVQLER